jgi:cold shock CspA family protein
VVARSGQSLGTVVRWDDERGRGYVELPESPGESWVEAAVVRHSTGAEALRAGQVVDVEWTESDDGDVRAVRVTPRDDLHATLGG